MKHFITLLCVIVTLNSFSQNHFTFTSTEWYVSNFTTNDLDILKSDTLILHRYEWTDKKSEHRDSTFSIHDRWNLRFDDFGGLGIGWIDYLSAARGGEPPYYNAMYPCQNLVWQIDKKTLTFYIDGFPYIFQIVWFKENENECLLTKYR